MIRSRLRILTEPEVRLLQAQFIRGKLQVRSGVVRRRLLDLGQLQFGGISGMPLKTVSILVDFDASVNSHFRWVWK